MLSGIVSAVWHPQLRAQVLAQELVQEECHTVKCFIGHHIHMLRCLHNGSPATFKQPFHFNMVTCEVTEMAAELQAVMIKNPKRARLTCTKEYRRQRAEHESQGDEGTAVPSDSAEQCDSAVQIWEISDGEDELNPLNNAGLFF